jgi:deoxyribodipyrimidine photo-lyase
MATRGWKFRSLPQNSALGAVYANRDYEPSAIARDGEISRRLASADFCFMDFKDQVIFERDEVMTQGGTPFSVFTPTRMPG